MKLTRRVHLFLCLEIPIKRELPKLKSGLAPEHEKSIYAVRQTLNKMCLIYQIKGIINW